MLRLYRTLLRHFSEGEIEGELGTLVDTTFHVQTATKEVAELAADREAKPGAAELTRCRSISLGEGFEDSLLVLRGNAPQGIIFQCRSIPLRWRPWPCWWKRGFVCQKGAVRCPWAGMRKRKGLWSVVRGLWSVVGQRHFVV